VAQGGADRHAEIRGGLAGIIRRQRGDADDALSPHWQGVDRPHRARSRWKPFWIAVAACVAALTVAFTGLSYALSGGTERVAGQLSVLSPGGPAELERKSPPVVVPPTPQQEAQIARVSGFLTDEIAEGLVAVFQDANTITVRIAGSGMFGSGSDDLRPAFEVPLARVAAALNGTEGPVIVAGHSDSSPIRTARFKSNMALSLARAEAVKATLAAQLDDPARLGAEGRSDAEPIADNATAEGRAQNRRIEIVLVRKDAT
jgi:type VI secretion system protein ImpK